MSDVFSCDAVVIGAGVVGLAVARRLAMARLETMILEKNEHFGMETSARNSEVIHAGIYYPKNSRKAEFCVRGRDLLYPFCESHGVGHKRLGKLIVATHPDQSAKLAGIAKAAAENGVGDLRPVTKAQIAALEPDLFAVDGLFSPSTGIIDSHQYMLALLGGAESYGAALVRQARVIAIAKKPDGYALTVDNAGSAFVLNARILINSAGLWAQNIAGLIDALPRRFVPNLVLAKGNYATLSVKSPFRHLVYPVPEPGGLGVHLTLDLGGQARFGPNVQWLESNDPVKIDYSVPPLGDERICAAYRAILARHKRGNAVARLFRCQAQNSRAGKSQPGFSDRWTGCAWHARTGQYVRHRVAGADRVFGDC